MAQKGQTPEPSLPPREARADVASPSPRSPGTEAPLSPELLQRMDAYWRAANYLSVGQIYLFDNPLS
jgi:XFP N-terminal domain